MKSFIHILCYSIILIGSLKAQETPTVIIERFFEEFEQQGSSVAIDNLYKSNKWVTNSKDVITQIKSKMKTELENPDFIGEYFGYEQILMKSLNPSLKLYSYMVKYHRQPIRFNFTFYKPDNIWMIYSFKYDGNIPDELEEAAKIYYEVNKF